MTEKVGYHLSTTVNERIVHITVTGATTKQTLGKLREDFIAVIEAFSAQAVLADVRTLTGPHEIVDAYFRVRSLPTHLKMIPCAVVDSSDGLAYHSFYEDTATNAGAFIKWFVDIHSAEAWLKNKLNERTKNET